MPGHAKWEYPMMPLLRVGFEPDQLNEHGQEGWELVAVDREVAYFKQCLN